MPRGKNTNVNLACPECNTRFYTTRINKKTITGKKENNKFCKKCRKVTKHTSTSEIKHSS